MRLLPALLAAALAAAPLAAQSAPRRTAPAAEPTPRPAPADRLGRLRFPTSAGAAAQADFVRGLLLLHSFEYERAAEAFRAAQRREPGFALAYWGEALTHTHPLWNQQALDSARAILARLAPTPAARAAKARTPRERAWLETVEVLYGEGTKAQRDTLYAQALERLVAAYPDDEARLFHALALMGLSQSVRDVPTYMRAGAIALDVFGRQPEHPGAAHYVIHAFDDPVHAPLGLEAANAYATIAPGAAHAQHMTTHIFLALGDWPRTESQNILASGPDRSRWQAGHYTYWLHYALLQQGRFDEAAALLEELRAHAGPQPPRGRLWHLLAARAQQVLTGARWDDPALAWPLAPAPADLLGSALHHFTLGFAAIGAGRAGDAAPHLAALADLRGRARSSSDRVLASTALVLDEMLRAAARRAAGDRAEATAMLRAAADSAAGIPMAFGPPDLAKPPLELLGEWLLEDGDTTGARQAFAAALRLTPGRRPAVRGLAAASGTR